jgi:glycerol-3-phosphate acyltransferase PlsY
MLNSLLALVMGYLLGAIPSAYLIARLKGKNVFELGSGNMGAMNTARNLGMGWGIVVLLLDIGKGALATYLGLVFDRAAILPALAAGLGAIIGHAFSIYVGFKGGKALATAFGLSLPLYPLGGLFGLLSMIVLTALLKRRSNLAAGITVGLYPLLVFLALHLTRATNAGMIVVSVLFMAVIIFIKHLPSLKQELTGKS